MFTNKHTAVRLVYQLNTSDRCVYDPQTLPASDDFKIHTWPRLKTSVIHKRNAFRILKLDWTFFEHLREQMKNVLGKKRTRALFLCHQVTCEV